MNGAVQVELNMPKGVVHARNCHQLELAGHGSVKMER